MLVCVYVCVCSCITAVLDDRGELINPDEPDLHLISISVCRCQHACNTQRARVHIMRACTCYVELQAYHVNGIRCILSKRVIASKCLVAFMQKATWCVGVRVGGCGLGCHQIGLSCASLSSEHQYSAAVVPVPFTLNGSWAQLAVNMTWQN